MDQRSMVDLESERESLRVKRKTLEAVLHHCQRALESTIHDNSNNHNSTDTIIHEHNSGVHPPPPPSPPPDLETDELFDLIKSRVECPGFLEKLECAQASFSRNTAEEGNSWDMVSDSDLWEDKDVDSTLEDYVLVKQEDIVEGIACFMAAYLLSLKQTKDLTPLQLQEALSKTFSVKKKKGKLQKAWDGSKVIYNVASWGATAIGIYQNPVIVRAATKAFWTSCQVISKLL
ncbi:hypothetical protein PIB30_058708 [Stylosanthes scabra]|uniref:Uncharacterized protein n=1 Tax=Stylosanthes scabra TaxID=79078 RepID=A0ABU6QJQ6_9FABA|nr:hypothetical protein [Stylosanthes scabra]